MFCSIRIYPSTLTSQLLSVILLAAHGWVSQAASCPVGCESFGTCYQPLGRCDCPWNLTGPACDQPVPGFCLDKPEVNTCQDNHPTLCVNACNHRGNCVGGFCHCQTGFYGTDCSLSSRPDRHKEVLLAGLGYPPAQDVQPPRIYVYELPPEFHVKRDLHTIDRPPMHLALYERILTSGHRTTDGDTADYYYIPVTSRDLKKGHLLMPMLHYVASHWPWWNATHGARHILLAEGDVGTCELPIAVRERAANATFLQFWGMYDYHPKWEHVYKGNPNRLHCHVPGKDIVVPFIAMSSHDRFLVETPLRPDNDKPVRNLTFFFSGGVCGSGRYKALPPNCTHYKQQRYSGGVRQAIYENYHNRLHWKVVTRTDSYARDYSTSKFCLAAPGGGWGKRGIVASMYGCIPVSATDYLYEAFEPELSWSHFGVRVPQSDIPKLGDLLDNMPPDQVTELQRRTACAAQHFHWSSNVGGIQRETGEFDAFATIMAILRMRLKYPGVSADKYYQMDAEFRDFVDCQPAKRAVPLPPLCTMFIGPLYQRYADTCPPARYYMRRRLGPPGGAVCAGALDLASCKHLDQEVTGQPHTIVAP